MRLSQPNLVIQRAEVRIATRDKVTVATVAAIGRHLRPAVATHGGILILLVFSGPDPAKVAGFLAGFRFRSDFAALIPPLWRDSWRDSAHHLISGGHDIG